ncbi:MAG: RNA polymerase sigma factor [Deltaproteobacteria bacterium]|nr:RNA polymerase sigma factor [Deltaproteobacteria bacterium]
MKNPSDKRQLAMETPSLSLDDLFRRYSRYVGAIGLRLLGSRDEIDDLVQDVFLAAARGLDRLQDPAAAKAWLITITVRKAKRRLQQRRMQRWFGFDKAVDYEQLPDRMASPEERVDLVRVYAALDRLPVRQRLPWTLRHIQGERLATIAMLCECSLATAKRRISEASAAMGKVWLDD